MDTLFVMLWIFDIAILLCMSFIYFSQHHCSKISLAFINIIPPSALAMASLVGAFLPYPAAVLSAFLLGFMLFYAGNRILIRNGRSAVPVYPSGLIALLSIPIWAVIIGTIGLYILVQMGYAH